MFDMLAPGHGRDHLQVIDARDVAGFTPSEADQLRQAMGSKRSRARMERLKARFYEGMAGNGITGDVADAIYEKLAAFANFGFPESHSVSFAYLVYASSWLKRFYPAAFCAGLLDAQPMGFYSPHTLVQDARRHGVEVRDSVWDPVRDIATRFDMTPPAITNHLKVLADGVILRSQACLVRSLKVSSPPKNREAEREKARLRRAAQVGREGQVGRVG